MNIVISSETKLKLGTKKAPMPPPSKDPNIGKKTFLMIGAYAGIYGIIYPKVDELVYHKDGTSRADGSEVGGDKPYSFNMFYKDGTFFCAVPTDLTDTDLPVDPNTPPPGAGTAANPFICGKYLIPYKTPEIARLVWHDNIHVMPPVAGQVEVIHRGAQDYDRPSAYFIIRRMNIVFGNGLPTFATKTNIPNTSDVLYVFDYDPARHGDKVVVKTMFNSDLPDARTASHTYFFYCPKPKETL